MESGNESEITPNRGRISKLIMIPYVTSLIIAGSMTMGSGLAFRLGRHNARTSSYHTRRMEWADFSKRNKKYAKVSGVAFGALDVMGLSALYGRRKVPEDN
jgi:hypothetical protein